jgi:fumarate reductase subunit D
MTKRSNEPFPWALFGAGGFIAAFLIPVHLLLFTVLLPLGLISQPTYQRMVVLAAHPLTRLYLFFLCALSFFHAGHRIRFTLSDAFDIKHLNPLLSLLGYGGALAGTIISACLLF